MTTLIAGSGQVSKRGRRSTAAAFSPSRALAGAWALQRDRWILWLPVGIIAGAALWLLTPSEPPAWIGAALFVGGAAAACALVFWPTPKRDGVLTRGRQLFAALCAMAAALGLGATASALRSAIVAQTPYVGSDQPVEVQGWVFANDASDNGPRLRILVQSIAGNAAPPRFVRVSVPQAGVLTPGRAARCRAVLSPPAGPMAPGSYDFARRAYFDRLGATGFGYGRCRPIVAGPPLSWFDRARLQLAAIQSDLGAAIIEAAPGRGGAIAAALVTGDRSGIDEETNDALRNSGLGHLLSVSGVHMGIVGGLVFAALLGALSLIGPLALRLPVKKLAAAGALIALAAYFVISGASVPALRSFVMAGVAFGAILLDRPAISMRGLALATVIVVLIFPDSVLEPGFQMSFAATMALVALFEMLASARRAEATLPAPGWLIGALQWSARGVGGVMLISLVAGIATDPFAIYHFQRFSIYALISNLIVEPIISFIVAPAAAIAAVLAPFGAAHAPLQVMSSALDLVAAVGQTFGSRPEAVRALPQPPDLAFVLCVLGLTWTCLWRGNLRWGGIAFLAASIAVYVAAPQPIAAFDADLRAVYARATDGHWLLMRGHGRSTYARDRLGGALGISPPKIERLAAPDTCSDAACTWRSEQGASFALVRDVTGFERACVPHAAIIAAIDPPADYRARCAPRLLISASDIAAQGGGYIYEEGASLRVTRAWPPNVHRAWTPVHPSAGDQE